MSLNIHPIIVHFPIALLSIYALLEFVPIKSIRQNSGYNVIKLFLLFVGEVGMVAAGLTGSLASQGAFDNPNIRYPHVIHTHSFFAELTFVVFGLISLLYFINLMSGYFKLRGTIEAIGLLSEKAWIMAPLALFGVAILTVTGALGGVVVYGPNLDPFTHFVYQTFVH